MNWWRIIWAIYILTLSGVPCEAVCQDEVPAQQTSRPASDEHNDEAGCSPFCFCGVCPGFAIPQPPQFMTTALPASLIMSVYTPGYQAPHALELPGRIWQPPRVG